MERGSKERIIVPIIKKGRAPFVSLRIIGKRKASLFATSDSGNSQDGENCGEWDGQTANSNDGSLS